MRYRACRIISAYTLRGRRLCGPEGSITDPLLSYGKGGASAENTSRAELVSATLLMDDDVLDGIPVAGQHSFILASSLSIRGLQAEGC
jgi:hypothetical protein